MNSLSMNDILKKIDEMVIYEEDYPIIISLLNTGNYKFITAVIEEVVKGNLFWSDFDEALPHDKYRKILERSFKDQEEIQRKLEYMREVRKTTLTNIELKKYYASLGIVRSHDETDDLWKEEYDKIRDNLIYELTTERSSDSILLSSYKKKLLNALENGRAVLSLGENDGTYNYIRDPAPTNEKKTFYYTKNDNGKFIENGNTTIVSGTETAYYLKFEILSNYKNHNVLTGTSLKVYDNINPSIYLYINPDDILFSVKDYIIPLDFDYQTLTESDIQFMLDNNMTEDSVKKLKTAYKFLKYNDYLNQNSIFGGSNNA